MSGQPFNEESGFNDDNHVGSSKNELIISISDGHEETFSTISVKRKEKPLRRRIFKIVILLLIAVIIATIILVVVLLNRRSTNISAKKVLFVIVDGVPADVIEKVTTPNIDRISSMGYYKRAYVGGEINTYSETFTISSPGYMSLLTGTWGNKHNVYDNSVENPNYNYKNIFRLVKEQQPNKKIGIFSTWIDNRVKLIGEGLSQAGNLTFDYKFDGYELDLINYPHDSLKFVFHQIDERVINESVNCIKENSPDISWVYLQYTDDMGHLYGDSEQLNQSVIYFDQQIQRISQSIEYRMKHFNEDWLLVITTDHGRDAISGKDHGKQTERERTTWIVINNKQTNNYFKEYEISVVDIFPTMASFMNIQIPIESQRELDGISFFGKVSLIQPHLDLRGNNLTIQWKSLDDEGDVHLWLTTTNLYKVGLIDNYKLVASVPIQQQEIRIDLNNYPSNFYKIVLQGKYNMVNRWIVKS